MAKQSRSKSRSVRKQGKGRSHSRAACDNDIVVDINDFTLRSDKERQRSCKHPLIEAINQSQGQYLTAIRTNQLVLGLGPAGGGKTFCAAAMAVEAFERREIGALFLPDLRLNQVRAWVFCQASWQTNWNPGLPHFAVTSPICWDAVWLNVP